MKDDLKDPESVARLRERFLRMVGHDLQNPLASILMNGRVLLKPGELTERQLRYATRVCRSAEKMSRMLAEIGDAARALLGVPRKLQLGDCNLEELCRRVAEPLIGDEPDRKITIDVPAACQGRWDEERIVHVLWQLLDNAVVHGAPGGPIRVVGKDLGDTVSLDVHNTGEPIPEAELETLFEPARASGTTPAGGGLGLGLYVASEIARAHGGSLRASSGDQGTTFFLRLPKSPPATADEAPG